MPTKVKLAGGKNTTERRVTQEAKEVANLVNYATVNNNNFLVLTDAETHAYPIYVEAQRLGRAG